MKNIIRMSLVAGALVSSVAAQAQTAWTDKVTFGGDLRFRLNNIDDESVSTEGTQTNNQIRGRLTVSGKVNDAMTANFRMATVAGSNDYRSANHTLGTTNDDAGVVFELAYGDWRVMPGLVVSMGKAPNPFWQALKNEMLWDADLSFDGVTAKYTADMDTLKPFVNLSYTTLNDSGNTTSSATLMGAQAGTSLGLGDKMNGTVAVGYHTFSTGAGTGALPVGALTKNPKLLDVTAELGLNMIANLPMSVGVDWVTNSEAVNDKEDQGFLAGIKVGQFANVGSWEAWYSYRDVASEALVGGLADSEFAAGDGAGVLGHQVGAGYMAWDNTTVGLNYWMNKRAAAETDYTRLTADLVWKF